MIASPLVSVVTPFHNTAAYLRECLDSILAQTYREFELILQDNASDDGSTEIALEYARRDPRIRYFRIDPLLEQVPNYNLALTRISPASKYTKIVQADDTIVADCLRQMVDLAERSPTVGIVSAYRLSGDTVRGDDLPCQRTILPGREAAQIMLLESPYLVGSPSTVMYRSEIVRKRRPFFEEGRLAEDTEACFDILRHWDLGYVHQVLSYSRTRPESIGSRLERNEPYRLNNLLLLRRYGPDCLTQAEFDSRLDVQDREYYRQLARAALRLRESSYWEFHRQHLRSEGLQIEPLKLFGATGRELLRIVVNPLELVRAVKRLTRRLIS